MIIKEKTVTILDTDSLSEGINLGADHLAGIIILGAPAGNTITFQMVEEDDTAHDVYNKDGEVEYPFIADAYVGLKPDEFFGIKEIKVRTGNTGTPTAQTEDITVRLFIRIY
jgi:hypothetical protein